jgi:hypothetical protein
MKTEVSGALTGKYLNSGSNAHGTNIAGFIKVVSIMFDQGRIHKH